MAAAGCGSGGVNGSVATGAAEDSEAEAAAPDEALAPAMDPVGLMEMPRQEMDAVIRGIELAMEQETALDEQGRRRGPRARRWRGPRQKIWFEWFLLELCVSSLRTAYAGSRSERVSE